MARSYVKSSGSSLKDKIFTVLIVIFLFSMGYFFGTISKTIPEIKEYKINNIVRPNLPRDTTESVYDNYTNSEVRDAVFFARYYLNNPELLKDDHLDIYNEWYDYRKRACQNETINKIMEHYNYWIISYAFGI